MLIPFLASMLGSVVMVPGRPVWNQRPPSEGLHDATRYAGGESFVFFIKKIRIELAGTVRTDSVAEFSV